MKSYSLAREHENAFDYLEDAKIFGHFRYDLGLLGSGMMLDDEKLLLYNSADIFPNIRKNKKRKLRRKDERNKIFRSSCW